jgi:hypothetical protein
MPDQKEIKLRIVTPYSGYQKYTTFNRFFVESFEEYLMVSFGLVRGRGHLGELHILLDKKMLHQNRQSNLKYLDTLSSQGLKEADVPAWEPMLPATDMPPVINQMFLSHVHGAGEINLLNYSRRALWDEHQLNTHSPNRELTIHPDAYALLTSTISIQIAFVLKVYSFFKPEPSE